jgi:hypothetical protein
MEKGIQPEAVLTELRSTFAVWRMVKDFSQGMDTWQWQKHPRETDKVVSLVIDELIKEGSRPEYWEQIKEKLYDTTE